jgi:tetratricopeptide (TPR) repeat protein
MIVRVWALAGVLLLAGAVAAQAAPSGHSTAEEGGCAQAEAARERGQLEAARSAYLEVLAGNRQSECATRGLDEVAAASRAEDRLCAEGKALAKGGEDAEARQRYVAALEENVDSECAAAGLSPAGKDLRDRLEEWSDFVVKLLPALGAVILALLLGIGAVLLVLTVVMRLLRTSLRIEPFLDGAVEPKVGSAVASLVETQLLDLSRQRGGPKDAYKLDLVVADVELLAGNASLASAVEGLDEVPQLKVLVAVLSMIDRVVGRRSFVAKGELMPAGNAGTGVALSFHRHDSLRAREALWAPAPNPAPPPGPSAFYGLAVGAASWIQYEAACGIDGRVRLLTESSESWSHLATGLARQRQGAVTPALEAYVKALRVDPDNVGALVNLAVLVARDLGRHSDAIVLLLHARNVLLNRYEAQQ